MRKPADVFVARFIGSPSINILGGRLRPDGSALAVEVRGPGDGTGALLRRLANAPLVPPADGRVLVGVRPEDLVIHRETAPGRLRAAVEFVQPMGAVSFAVLRVPSSNGLVLHREDLMAAVGPEETFGRDTVVWLDIRGDRYCLFDPQTGRAIQKG